MSREVLRRHEQAPMFPLGVKPPFTAGAVGSDVVLNFGPDLRVHGRGDCVNFSTRQQTTWTSITRNVTWWKSAKPCLNVAFEALWSLGTCLWKRSLVSYRRHICRGRTHRHLCSGGANAADGWHIFATAQVSGQHVMANRGCNDLLEGTAFVAPDAINDQQQNPRA